MKTKIAQGALFLILLLLLFLAAVTAWQATKAANIKPITVKELMIVVDSKDDADLLLESMQTLIIVSREE